LLGTGAAGTTLSRANQGTVEEMVSSAIEVAVAAA